MAFLARFSTLGFWNVLFGIVAVSGLIPGIGIFFFFSFKVAYLFFPGHKFNSVHCVRFVKEIKRKYLKSPVNSLPVDNQS